jgi:hypothetical protein
VVLISASKTRFEGYFATPYCINLDAKLEVSMTLSDPRSIGMLFRASGPYQRGHG